jgi:hypothetical protein
VNPFSITGWPDWFTLIWAVFLPLALVTAAIFWLIDRIRR